MRSAASTNLHSERWGPVYRFRQINPVDDQDGGEPGGNIRVGLLFNSARVSFIDRAGGTPPASQI
jgi:hypothetical protein